MLILERHSGEAIHINDDIKLTIYYNKGSQIKMGIDAPRHISIMREELLESKTVDKPEPTKTEQKEVPCLSLIKHISPVVIKTKRKRRIISHSL